MALPAPLIGERIRWTRETCLVALAGMPEGYLRPNDAFDYCARTPALKKYQAVGLWGALHRYGLIRKTRLTIDRSNRRFYWERVPAGIPPMSGGCRFS